MYVSPWLQALLLPRKWDVCGVIVPPLSLWHVHILSACKNPYIVGGYPDKDSATELLIYASQDVENGRRLYLDSGYRRKVAKRIVKRLKRLSEEEVRLAVCEYVQECMRVPAHKIPVPKPGEVKPKGVKAPIPWILAEYVSGGNPDKVEKAFNTPYSMACCLFDAGRNVRGDDDSVIGEDDEERIDKKLEAREKESE